MKNIQFETICPHCATELLLKMADVTIEEKEEHPQKEIDNLKEEVAALKNIINEQTEEIEVTQPKQKKGLFSRLRKKKETTPKKTKKPIMEVVGKDKDLEDNDTY